MKRITLAADTINGVYYSEIPTDADVLYDRDFMNILSSVKDGEIIYGDVSNSIAEEINNEYGIRS